MAERHRTVQRSKQRYCTLHVSTFAVHTTLQHIVWQCNAADDTWEDCSTVQYMTVHDSAVHDSAVHDSVVHRVRYMPTKGA